MEAVQRNLLIIAIIVLVLSLMWTVYRYIKFYKTEHFVCPECEYIWKPSVLKMVFSTNAVEGKIIRCPRCGTKKYIEPTKVKP